MLTATFWVHLWNFYKKQNHWHFWYTWNNIREEQVCEACAKSDLAYPSQIFHTLLYYKSASIRIEFDPCAPHIQLAHTHMPHLSFLIDQLSRLMKWKAGDGKKSIIFFRRERTVFSQKSLFSSSQIMLYSSSGIQMMLLFMAAALLLKGVSLKHEHIYKGFNNPLASINWIYSGAPRYFWHMFCSSSSINFEKTCGIGLTSSLLSIQYRLFILLACCRECQYSKKKTMGQQTPGIMRASTVMASKSVFG